MSLAGDPQTGQLEISDRSVADHVRDNTRPAANEQTRLVQPESLSTRIPPGSLVSYAPVGVPRADVGASSFSLYPEVTRFMSSVTVVSAVRAS